MTSEAIDSERSRGRLLVRLATVLLLMALVGLAVVTLRWPWSIALLQEGFPGHTWPAEGRFVEVGQIAAPEPPPPNSEEMPSGLADLFDQSDGSVIAVARDGRIVFSHAAPDFSVDTSFNSYSMVKSLVGLLAIKAVSDGQVADLDVPVGDLWADAADSPVAEVTLRQLLDMRSGIVFEHPEGDTGGAETTKEQVTTYSPFSNFARLHIQGPDALLHDLEVVAPEQDRFVYQNLNTAILARVLEEVNGVGIETLIDRHLAGPADAGSFRWRRYTSADEVSAYCCLYAPVTWWVAVADHVLTNGTDDEPLLTDSWHDYYLGRDLPAEDRLTGVYRSQSRYDVFDRDGEDLSGPFLYFFGRGGQITYLIPDDRLVIVRFGERDQLLHSTGYEASRALDSDP